MLTRVYAVEVLKKLKKTRALNVRGEIMGVYDTTNVKMEIQPSDHRKDWREPDSDYYWFDCGGASMNGGAAVEQVGNVLHVRGRKETEDAEE